MDTVRVRVGDEWPAFPVLVIAEELHEGPNRYLIPRELFDQMEAAYRAAQQADRAIMNYIGQHYPNADDVLDWLERRG